MDGRPKAYDPFLAPTMPPIPPIGGGGIGPVPADVDPKAYSAAMMARDSSLPSINSLMRVPTTSASPVGGYNPHLAAQQQLGMYQPYSGVGAAPGIPVGYQGLPMPLPTPSGAPSVVASPLQPIAVASESPQIYDLDKNFHLNAPVPQYPPGGEIPPPGYGGHYHQRPPMYGNYHPTSSYNYNDDYYLASTYNNYSEYGNPMGYQPVTATPGAVDPAHGGVLQPLGQQVTQLQPVLNQQPPPASLTGTLSSGNGQQPHHQQAPIPPVADGPGGASATTGSSVGGSVKKSGSSGGSSSGGSASEKKAEKKPTMSSMARYVCSHCDGKEFASLPVISKHIRQHNLHLCNLCVRTFETTDDLKSHECRPKGSNVSYPKCPICLKYLSNSWSLSRHMKTHNREQGGSSVSKDLSSSSDIKSSESEESSNAKLDLEGSAMDCDELSKDMGMLSRSVGDGAGDDMELELDGHESQGSHHHLHTDGDTSSGPMASQEMNLKSPRVMVEKLSFPHFIQNNSHSHNNIKSGPDTSSSCSEGGKTDDEGLVDEKTKKEQQAMDVPLEKCIVCGKEFKNRTYLYKHLKSVHTAKILKSPSECNSQPGSPVMMKGCGEELSLDNGNAPIKSSVARALASKLSRKQQQLNGKGDEDPLCTDSNNNGSNGGDYLVPLTSANANQININTSGNSITIISNVTYCNTAHEVPITTSTSGPNVGTPVTTASEALSSSTATMGGGGLMTTTVAGSNGTTSTGQSSGLAGDGRRLSVASEGAVNGRLAKEEGGLGHAFKVESTDEKMLLDPATGMIKQELHDSSLQQEDVLDKMGNKMLEPPPFIIQKVKQEVVVVTGSEATIVQPNLINSDSSMLGKMPLQQYEQGQPQPPATAPPPASTVVKSEPQDPFANSKSQTEDPYAFNVEPMESHFGNIGGVVLPPPSSQMQQQQQPENGQQQPIHHSSAFESQQSMQQSHQMQSNPSQLDPNHTSQHPQQSGSNSSSSSSNNGSGSNNYYGGPHQQHTSQTMQPQQQQQYMNPPHQQPMQPNHAHMQAYDPLKMYPEPHHLTPTSSSAGGMEFSHPSTSTPNHSYHHQQPGQVPLVHPQSLHGEMQSIPQQPPQSLQVSQMDPMAQNAHLDNNPPSQQTSIDNSADFDGDTVGDGEQESFQSGGDGGADGDGEVKTQICDECGKSFAKRSQLTRHKNIHKNIIYICPFCQREPFKARNSLKNHLKTNHKDMKDKWEDPAYISAQVIKEPEKVDEYMRNWNEKTKPGLNTKGGSGGSKGEEKHPVDMLESMSNSIQMGVGAVGGLGGIAMGAGGAPNEPAAATPKGKKKKGSKAKGGGTSAAETPAEIDTKPNVIQNGPPGKVDPLSGAPDYYNGVPGAGAAPMHHQHYGGQHPYPTAYQPPYMGIGQQVPGGMGEYGQLPPQGMEHHHMQQQPPLPPPPPHHHQLGGPQGGLYQAPGAYQSQHLMGPGGPAAHSPYGQPYPPPPPGHQQQQPLPPQHGHGPTAASSGGGAGSAAGSGGGQQYGGGHHGKSSNSVPASPLRSSLQSPMSPPVSPHPQQFYQQQLPPGHHYYGAGGGAPQQPQAPVNPYRSTSGLTSRQSPAPFSPHPQQPQRTQSTDSASSAMSGSAAANSGSALVTNQYGAGPAAYHPQHHPTTNQQQQQQQQQHQPYQPPQHHYGPLQGAIQGHPPPSTPSNYGPLQGHPPPSTPSGGVGPIPPTPPPSASSFSSNASTSSTSSTSSAYGQQQSATPSLHHQHHHTGQSAYHTAGYDGQQPPPSKRPRYYPPGGAAGATGGPPPPTTHQQQPQQQQQNHHHVQQQQQQYYGAQHYHMPPNGGGGPAPAGGAGPLSHHHQMYNGMQPPPPSGSSSSNSAAGGQSMGAPGYQ